ncbi:LysR family transcriptional regulator [Legionella pneumophila serogroup 1]|uniref:LysR family transcriptional regulator n=1 Tax=Legionella pneumophila TaxID=446 RepID=UPI0005B37A26|nr:LysR family transcriptional regulator [Legionella pneumophila]AMQ28413.1 LysR family transcriptional regulator [Legionella pneumophila subsp. pneumophila]AMV14941.1 HTH-type transcriptional regulator LeuO [Legionella pneumophila]ANN93114.1 LysR family transcriptional regulator [Legionella pneumophila]MBN5929980.1 LysR family transcriptional regulator [Legionella pneumophila]MCZ4677373.1 LysR family transcriptional regulator [Legionella pneumophila]
MDLRKINLNLLLHLDTLLNELSVSKAAEKSFMSQTAMSHILKQLRDIFDDPLFIRKPHGLQPTQKVLDLAPKIKKFLNYSNDIFEEDTFNPGNDNLFLKAASVGTGEYFILPRLCAHLAKNAPKFVLKISSLSEYLSLEYLLMSELDFAIGPGFVETGNNIIRELLFEEEAVCVMHKSHPLANQELTQDMYLQAEHIDIQFSYMGNENVLYKALQGYHQRNIKVIVPNIISALEVVYHTNFITTVPRTLAVTFKDRYQIELHPFPFPKKTFLVNFYYHKRLSNHKPLQWVLDVIKKYCCVNHEA